MAGSGSRLSTRNSLSSQDAVARRRRLEDGDLKTAEFGALNPRRRVPALVDDDFALAESAAIVEYIEERWPSGPALVAIRASARSSGAWCAKPMTIWPTSASVGRGSEGALNDLRQELALW